MFYTYSYKTVQLAGIQRNQTYKKIELKLKKQTKKWSKLSFYSFYKCFIFILFMVARVYICSAYFSWMFNEMV